MRFMPLLLGIIPVVAMFAVAAAGGTDPLNQDWPRLQGTWVTDFRKSPYKTDSLLRKRLELRLSGVDHLFQETEESKTADGKTHSIALHSSVLVVTAIREREHKRYLVVCPKMEPKEAAMKYATEIEYQFANGKLRLKGSLGSSRLTDDWTKLPSAPEAVKRSVPEVNRHKEP